MIRRIGVDGKCCDFLAQHGLLLGHPSPFVTFVPRHPVIFSADDWGVQSPPQHSIWVPLPFSEGDWIPTVCDFYTNFVQVFVELLGVVHRDWMRMSCSGGSFG